MFSDQLFEGGGFDDPLPNILSLQLAACKLARCLMKAANQVTDHLIIEDTVIEEDLSDTYLSTIHACFNLGFEVSCDTLCPVYIY